MTISIKFLKNFLNKYGTHSDKQFFEKEFFSQNIEKLFEKYLSKINNLADQWNQKIEINQILSSEEKSEFAQLLAIQYLRMPNIRKKYGDGQEKLTNKIIEIIASGLGYKDESTNITYDKEFNPILHSQLFSDGNLIVKIAEQLINKNWIFYYSPHKNIFTSDNPILIKPHIPNQSYLLEGFGMKGAEIIFPIGHSVLLSIIDDEFCPTDHLDNFSVFNAKSFREYNILQYIWSNKEVYSYSDNFQLINLVKEANGNIETFMKGASFKVNGK